MRAERLPDYARSLAEAPFTAPEYDEQHHYRGEARTTLAYIVTLDAINFGSGYFPHLVKPPGLSGYHTVALALTRWWQAGPPDARALADLTPAETARLLGQPSGDASREELMGLFARALNDLGDLLLTRYEGRYEALVAAAGHSAAQLVVLLCEMPFYRDVVRYESREVPLMKRAQITASDLALALGGEGWGRFDDLDDLTIFADNLVPHVLHTDEVLTYSPELAARLGRREVLEPGEPAEVELRAVAVHAVERLREALAAVGVTASARHLDILLWNRGQAERYRRHPRHRCRTVYY